MTPVTTPSFVNHLAHIGRAPVLVTGASGTLGRYVLEELALSATPARALFHRSTVAEDVEAMPGDLRTGRGLKPALADVNAVIHVASTHDETFDGLAMTTLLRAIERHSPTAHVVFVSQVGCWESSRAAARAKCDAENALTSWGGRYSIIRATPSHERVYATVKGRGIYGGTNNLAVTPLDLDFVARTCVDTAARHTPLGSPLDLYGPETHTLHEFAQLCAHLEGSRSATGAWKAPVTRRALRGEVWASVPPAHTPEPRIAPDAVLRGGLDFAAWWAREHDKNA